MSDSLARAREVATAYLDDLCDGLQEERDVDRLVWIIAEARLEEAKWWHDGTTIRLPAECCKRIIELAASLRERGKV